MKIGQSIAVLAVAVALVVGIAPTPAKADVDVSFGLFYNDLSSHGSWYVSSQYGRVWQPSVYAADWNPYYDGHWEYTDLGWTWVSDYDWGSIPYHYGTWTMDARYGWVWVPGYTWAPSWVVFRSDSRYCGWAPVPVGWSIGASVNIDPSFFLFVSSRDFLAPRIRVAAIPRSQTTVIVQRTKIINNINIQNNVVVNRGPDVRTIESATHRRIEAKPIERVARVAPFENVSKDRLRVTPEQARTRNVRPSEPVSADRPLPDRTDRNSRTENRPAPQPPRTQERPDHSNPDRSSVNEPRSSQDQSRAHADQQKRDADRAKAQADASARAQARADADRRAAQDKARADADRRAAEQQSRSQAQANAAARQRTEHAPQDAAAAKAHADANAKAKAQADQRAQADAKAKAQADAKRKADAKKKKEEPPPPKDDNNQDKH